MPGWELPVALPSSNIQTCGLKGAAPGCQHAPVHRQSPPVGWGRGSSPPALCMEGSVEQWELRGAQEAQQLPMVHPAVCQWTVG